jgi:hypothetical protein
MRTLARLMTSMWLGPLLVLAVSQSVSAGEPSQEPYSAEIGDKKVTSVKRQPGQDVGVFRGRSNLNKLELLKAARTSVSPNLTPDKPAE